MRVCNTCDGTGVVKNLHNWATGGKREQDCWNCHEVEAQQPAPSAAAAVVVYEQKENEMQVWFRPARMHGHPERTPIKATITKDRGNGIVDLTYDDGEFSGNARAVPNALRLPRNVREQVAVWWDVGFEMDFQTAVDNSLKKKKDDPPPQPAPSAAAASAVSDGQRALHKAILNRLSHAELLEKAHYLMGLNSNQARTIGELQDLLKAAPQPSPTPQADSAKEAPNAMQSLTAALKNDPEYAWAWHCNLAMPIMDNAKVSHRVANITAARLMQHLFGIDTEKHPHFEVADEAPQADSQPAPVGGAAELLKEILAAACCEESETNLTSDQYRKLYDLHSSIQAISTPPTQAADSVTAPAGGANWQDISTAPKDGTRFVAVGNNYGLYSETQHTCIAQWFRGCWMEVSDWNEASELKYLTHWMPLLPLPGSADSTPADSVTAPATESYVQPVPDTCDRIVWRGHYYHLPPTPPAQAADSVLEDADPLQGAANWLAQAHGQFCVAVLQGCLMIGYNRAKRLHDAAIAARKQGANHD